MKDGSEYFGPYASVKMMNTLLDLVRQLYPLRNCSHNLGKKQIEAGKYKVCLEYHIGNCLGPCEGLQSEEDYMETIRGIRSIIRGNIGMVRNQLHELMKQHADAFAFEKAQIIKEKIELLDRFQSKSLVVNPSINNVDVFSIIEDAQAAYVNFVKVASGAIIDRKSVV